MRISDWSSDVCSSDLIRHGRQRQAKQQIDGRIKEGRITLIGIEQRDLRRAMDRDHVRRGRMPAQCQLRGRPEAQEIGSERLYDRVEARSDRQSVLEGKRVSARVDLGGGRIRKK